MSRIASTVFTVFPKRAPWVAKIRISLSVLTEYRDACQQSADDYYITRPRVEARVASSHSGLWVLRDILELAERNSAYATYISTSTSLHCEETRPVTVEDQSLGAPTLYVDGRVNGQKSRGDKYLLAVLHAFPLRRSEYSQTYSK
jgi:hypothetical protein